MNVRYILPLCLLLAGYCVAQQDAAEVRKKSETVGGVECARLSLQAARLSLDEADKRFAGSDSKAAHQLVDLALHDVGHAVECSLKAPKYQKNAEIELRRLSRRINEMEKSLEAEESPYLRSAQAEVERQRDRLLHAMFGDAAGNGTEKKP
jgi:hypothetical protein